MSNLEYSGESQAPELPASQGSLDLYPFSDTELERIAQEINGNNSSSDGEFTAIANQVRIENQVIDQWSDIENEHKSNAAEAREVMITGTPISIGSIFILPQSLINSATGANPSMQDWSGDYDFNIRIKETGKARDPHFSSELNKLFINQNTGVTVYFGLNCNGQQLQTGQVWPAGLSIRAVVVYTKPDDLVDPVKVCPAHAFDSCGNLKDSVSDHLMRCIDDPNTIYGTDTTSGRHFLLVNLPQRQAGCQEVSLAFKFMDLGSCLGGVNRRDTAIIFTLERQGEVIGRRVLSLRICTSPRRDKASEESQLHRAQFQANNESLAQQQTGKNEMPKNPIVKVKENSNKSRKCFWVLARGAENFNALCQLGELLEKKDSGNLKEYRDSVNVMNGLLAKKPKLEKEESFYSDQ